MERKQNLGYSFNSGGFNNRSGFSQYKPYKVPKTHDANLFKVKDELVLSDDDEPDDRELVGDVVADQVGDVSLSMKRSTAPPKQHVGYDDVVVDKVIVEQVSN
jgi:hypothetical protein